MNKAHEVQNAYNQRLATGYHVDGAVDLEDLSLLTPTLTSFEIDYNIPSNLEVVCEQNTHFIYDPDGAFDIEGFTLYLNELNASATPKAYSEFLDSVTGTSRELLKGKYDLMRIAEVPELVDHLQGYGVNIDLVNLEMEGFALFQDLFWDKVDIEDYIQYLTDLENGIDACYADQCEDQVKADAFRAFIKSYQEAKTQEAAKAKDAEKEKARLAKNAQKRAEKLQKEKEEAARVQREKEAAAKVAYEEAQAALKGREERRLAEIAARRQAEKEYSEMLVAREEAEAAKKEAEAAKKAETQRVYDELTEVTTDNPVLANPALAHVTPVVLPTPYRYAPMQRAAKARSDARKAEKAAFDQRQAENAQRLADPLVFTPKVEVVTKKGKTFAKNVDPSVLAAVNNNVLATTVTEVDCDTVLGVIEAGNTAYDALKAMPLKADKATVAKPTVAKAKVAKAKVAKAKVAKAKKPVITTIDADVLNALKDAIEAGEIVFNNSRSTYMKAAWLIARFYAAKNGTGARAYQSLGMRSAKLALSLVG